MIKKEGLSIGLLGNAADIIPQVAKMGIVPDMVTDQTSAHDELDGYVPNNMSYSDALALRKSNPEKYIKESFRSMAEHVKGILKLKEIVTALNGNSEEMQAEEMGSERKWGQADFTMLN